MPKSTKKCSILLLGAALLIIIFVCRQLNIKKYRLKENRSDLENLMGICKDFGVK